MVCRGRSVVSKLAMERADALALIGQIQAQEQCEVLISGAVTLDAPQYSELENLGQILVRAQGQVFARTWHTMTASIPLEAQVKSYTGEKASRWTLSILGHRIDFFGKSGISFPEYDKITDTWALTLPGGRCIPASPPHSGTGGWRSPSRPSARRRSGALCRWSLLQKKMRPNHDRTDHQHRAH